MVGCVAMRDGDANARSHRRKVRLQRQSPEGFTDGKAQDLTRRCGECMSCCRALRRRGAWRGAATTSALGSRWQRAPSARRRRPRSRQGGEVHGVARCESAGTSRPRRNLGVVGEPPKKAAGTGVLRFWVVLICRCTSCPCVKTRVQTVILHTWRKIHSRRGHDETRVALTALSYYFSFVCPGFVREPLAYTYIHIHMLRG